MVQRFYHYELIAEIFHDEKSTTYLASSAAEPGKEIKLKVFRQSSALDQFEQQQLLQVVEILKSLQHPHLVPVLEAGVEDGQIFVASANMAGGSLRIYMDRAYPQTLPFGQALTICLQIGQALSALHALQLIHGCLRPDSILFDSNGQAFLEYAYPGQGTLLPPVSGEKRGFSTLYYAPEQWQNRADARSDQYALCCILYELLAGQPPFARSESAAREQEEPRALRSLLPDLSVVVDEAVMKGLARDPDHRHLDVQTLLHLLQQAQPRSTSAELPLPRAKRTTGSGTRPGSSSSPAQPVLSAQPSPSSASAPNAQAAQKTASHAPSETSGQEDISPPDVVAALSTFSSFAKPLAEENALPLSVDEALAGMTAILDPPPMSRPAVEKTAATPGAAQDNNQPVVGSATPAEKKNPPGAIQKGQSGEASAPKKTSRLQQPPASARAKVPVPPPAPKKLPDPRPTPADEAGALLSSPGSRQQGNQGQRPELPAKAGGSQPSVSPQAVASTGARADSGTFDALLADFSKKEEVFLKSASQNTKSQISSQAAFAAQQSIARPATGNIAQKDTVVLRSSSVPASSRFSAGGPRRMAGAFASMGSVLPFRAGRSWGQVPRPLLWAITIVFLLGTLITYLVLAAIPSTITALPAGSTASQAKPTQSDNTTLASVPKEPGSPQSTPSPTPGGKPKPEAGSTPTPAPIVSIDNTGGTGGSTGGNTGSSGNSPVPPPVPKPPAPVPTPTPTPKPAVPAVTYYHIVNRFSGKVLDDTNWSTANGTAIQQWSEVSGQTDQEWYLVAAGGGYYYIVNRYSGKVLDDTNWSTASGTPIQQWSEVSGQTDQEWGFPSSADGYVYISNRFSGKVLDDTNKSTANGTQIQQWTEQVQQTNQEWSLVAV